MTEKRDTLLIEGLPATVMCPTCGRFLKLWFNGGELDRNECHDTTWTLEHHPTVVLVTTQKTQKGVEE